MPHTLPETGRSLLSELEHAWRRSDATFALLDDAWLARPIPLRHPFVFYLGHLPAFAWNQVCRGILGRASSKPEFDELFERGIDPLEDGAAPAREAWPEVREIEAYRDEVRAALREAFDDIGERTDDPLCEGHRVYDVVLEHELMHHETLLYMLAELDPKRKRAPRRTPRPVGGPAPRQSTIAIPAGEVHLGADFDRVPFGWDNEFPSRRVAVPAFSIQRYPVTVEAFRAFVDDGGYEREELWRPGDFDWARERGLRHPHPWRERGGRWFHRTMFAEVPLDDVAGWPALVSEAEARAYCRWAGLRLPTEAELHRAAYGTPEGCERRFPWGSAPPSGLHGNFGARSWNPVPVGSCPSGASAFGVDELVGNGWEWTSTDFAPFEGFEPWIRTYPGYSADFFDGQHAVIFGAAWPTAERFLRRSFRNWFQRRYPYVFATFRGVQA